jgi:hypothetical protein
MRKLLLFLATIIAVSCGDESLDTSDLYGTWQLYETGFSPGVGYIVHEVPPIPAQTITFNRNGTVTSTVDGFDEFAFYKREENILRFYREDPADVPPSPNTIQDSFSFSFKENRLRLNYRGCIEGCHMAFNRKPLTTAMTAWTTTLILLWIE